MQKSENVSGTANKTQKIKEEIKEELSSLIIDEETHRNKQLHEMFNHLLLSLLFHSKMK